MLINFITALAWIIAVGLGGYITLIVTVFLFTRATRLTLGIWPLLLVAASIAWLIAKYTTQ
jgi:hypothetical protein